MSIGIGIGIGIGKRRFNWSNYWSTATPSTLVLTVLSDTSIKIDWTNAGTVDGHSIERSTDNVTFAEVGTVTGAVRTFTDTGLTAGTLYYYKVRARKGTHYSAYTSVVSSVVTVNIVLEGHSFLSGVIALDHCIVDRLNVSALYNAAVGGAVIADVLGRAATVDSKLVTETLINKNILVLYIGVNDITNTAGQGTTLYNSLKTYIEDRITSGWKIFVYTINPCTAGGRSAVFESERNIFNELLRTDLSTLNNVYVLDGDTIIELDDSTNIAYYSDLCHLTPEGSYLVSNLIINRLTTIYSNTVVPVPESSIPFTLTTSGTGAGVGRYVIQASDITTITLNGSGKFYKDVAGTTGENNFAVIEPGLDRTLYFKVTSGASICTFQHNKITRIAGFVSGTNAPVLTGDLSRFTVLTYFYSDSANLAVSGNLSLMPFLSYIVALGTNTLSGSITGLPLTYIQVLGNNNISGSPNPALITFLWIEGNNTLSGDVSLWTLCYFIAVKGSSTLSFTRLINLQSLGYVLVHTSVTLTSEIVNQLLADMWANKDYAKGTASRTINLLGSLTTGTPTGQGITDKAALQAYRSPTPPGTAALWTVTTR